MRLHDRLTRNLAAFGLLLAGIALLGAPPIPTATAQQLRHPLPNGSSNAALHYQRGMLFLNEVAPQHEKLLTEPLWSVVTPQMTNDEQNAITELLWEGRHAIRAGMLGSQQVAADFGGDLRAYGAALWLPHVRPMQKVANLIALYGMHQQGDEQWAGAAETFLSVVRMGHHLTEQLTLGESVKGIRILESAYYCLVTWGAHCPDSELITAARQALLATRAGSISPLAVIANEAATVELRIHQLQAAYPDGNWPEILLAAINVPLAAQHNTDWREFAKAEVVKRGVPATVFESSEAFDKYLATMRDTNERFYARTLAALSLPPEQAIIAGQRVHAEFADQLSRLGDPHVLSPAEIAAYYAAHEGAFRLLDVTLALCAQRDGELFPPDLTGLQDTFPGGLPVSPVGHKPVEYQVNTDRNGFRISFPSTKVGEVEVAEVAYEYNF